MHLFHCPNMVPVAGVEPARVISPTDFEFSMIWRMVCAHDSNGNPSINAAIFWSVHQNQRVNLLDNSFRKRNFIFYQVLNIKKCIFVPDSF